MKTCNIVNGGSRLGYLACPERRRQRNDPNMRQTFVSMSTYFILRDPDIFPDTSEFIPERWLIPREKLREHEIYLVPASKGTLGCSGRKNVEMKRDGLIGQTVQVTNAIRVKVLENTLIEIEIFNKLDIV
ncbi:hypothetical protein N7474_009599 [Penicillium riverlandense]|uniref:uncharacterized protein n=1 Tax=Penicillium riverlandense TaxID=1903569 RepID=UPI0025472476|nr:uncharacterized protein N7474_009599 [Penicillium riverlandense]KAJ5808330.1 hypothetical protein N7474_009599 [Penicillium riverlandense]